MIKILKNIICLFLGHVRGTPIILPSPNRHGWICERCNRLVFVEKIHADSHFNSQ